MKKTRKLVVLLLSLVLLLSAFSVPAFAQEKKTLSLLDYNVAGLPDFKAFIGKGEKDVKANQKNIGKIINSRSYDVVAVQEDFGYHSALVKELSSFGKTTNHTGGIPGGDGMNVYSKFPVYNEERVTWNKLYGVIDDGADEMTFKGILYCVIDLGDGVLIDLYDIHADAYGDAGSKKARRDNFRQLAEMINSKGTDRPVIVTGDFNVYFNMKDDDGLKEYMLGACSLKEAWVELHNGGNYTDFSSYFATGVPAWGHWDSVEKFFYRDGGGVSLVPVESEYEYFYAEDGTSLSDHASLSAVFDVIKTDDFKESGISLSVTSRNKFEDFIKRIFLIFTDLFKALTHLGDLKNVL